MIVVTSAAGFTGRLVVQALVARGAPVRALVRTEAQAQALRALGATQALVGDIRAQDVAAAALAGAQALYFICPRFAEDEPAIGRLWVGQGQAAGLPRFVYHAVAHPYLQAMPHHWDKLQVQIALEQSGLDFTVLQPTNYMRNLTWAWNELEATGVYRLPYSEHQPLTWVHAPDVAEVAARVLLEDGHAGGIYELCGTARGWSRVEVCELLSRRLGRPVRAERAEWDTWRELPRYRGWTAGQMRRLQAMFAYYDQHGFRAGNTRVLDLLLQRPCTPYEGYVEQLLQLPPAQRQAVL
jgi:NAD(P)H dehydrogenase (quinone)